jgi:hypothetical protein
MFLQWPSCLFSQPLSENRRQEMSREKLLSKLLLSIQAFTYTNCCELYEARRCYKRAIGGTRVAAMNQEDTTSAMFSRFGIDDIFCGGQLVMLAKPSSEEDGGAKAFDGRFGKLRYFALATMAAAGALASELIQITMPLPLPDEETDGMDVETPERSPVAFPLLLGHVLTHTTAAMFSVCGKARAKSDSLDTMWPVHLSPRVSSLTSDQEEVSGVLGDCFNFLKLGILARLAQALLGGLFRDQASLRNPGSVLSSLKRVLAPPTTLSLAEARWAQQCVDILEVCLRILPAHSSARELGAVSTSELSRLCQNAASSVSSFAIHAWAILQVLIPGAVAPSKGPTKVCTDGMLSSDNLIALLSSLGLENIETMIASSLVQSILGAWTKSAFAHLRLAASSDDDRSGALRRDLFRTQGFRVHDWPSAGPMDLDTRQSDLPVAAKNPMKLLSAIDQQNQPEHDSADQLELSSLVTNAYSMPVTLLLTGNTRKCVPLLGGYAIHETRRDHASLRIPMIPTSYTDLYAELGTILPDCEQTAVCLICGQVLNAGGRGECTRHAAKCGAGAGIFFLLQECTGLLLHKSKAAYIQSPFVDSHGETPQYRGRPLNLDMDRYELLRELWFSHGVRQKVVAERIGTRQMIVPDFY